jgi:hypothetical protein
MLDDPLAIADGFEIHRWYKLGIVAPTYEVTWEPSEWGDDDDDDFDQEPGEQSRRFETLDEAFAFGRALLDRRKP